MKNSFALLFLILDVQGRLHQYDRGNQIMREKLDNIKRIRVYTCEVSFDGKK